MNASVPVSLDLCRSGKAARPLAPGTAVSAQLLTGRSKELHLSKHHLRGDEALLALHGTALPSKQQRRCPRGAGAAPAAHLSAQVAEVSGAAASNEQSHSSPLESPCVSGSLVPQAAASYKMTLLTFMPVFILLL